MDEPRSGAKPPRTFRELVRALQSSEAGVRAGAAEELGKLGDGRALQPLVGLLERDLLATGPAVALALGELGDARAVPALVRVLTGATRARIDAPPPPAKALRLPPGPAAEPFWPGHVLRFIAARSVWKALGRRGEFRMALKDWASYRAERNRLEVQDCLERSREAMQKADGYFQKAEFVLEATTVLAGEAQLQAQAAAEMALARIGVPAVEALLRAVPAEGEALTGALIRVVSRVGKQAEGALVEALGHPDSRVRGAAAAAVGYLGEACPETLPRLLHDPEWGVRSAAATAFSMLGATAVPVLLTALRNADPGTRSAAVLALVVVGNPSVDGLIEVLASDTGPARDGAAAALGRIGDRRAVVPLLAVLQERSARSLLTAGKALAQLGEDWLVPELEALTKSEPAELATAAQECLDEVRHRAGWSVIADLKTASLLADLRRLSEDEQTADPRRRQVPEPRPQRTSGPRCPARPPLAGKPGRRGQSKRKQGK